ncbi:hypothetical protein ACROYT_G007510 [Oculina patagonica]
MVQEITALSYVVVLCKCKVTCEAQGNCICQKNLIVQTAAQFEIHAEWTGSVAEMMLVTGTAISEPGVCRMHVAVAAKDDRSTEPRDCRMKVAEATEEAAGLSGGGGDDPQTPVWM